LAYTEEFKESFIKEFLVRCQKDSTLSLRQFGIEKFGKSTSFIYQWLAKCDRHNKMSTKNIKKVQKNSANIKFTKTNTES